MRSGSSSGSTPRAGGKAFYGDKTPLYISFMEPIAGVLPEARFVHLVRDGRDVVLAYLERDKGPATVAEGAFHWRLRVNRGHRSGQVLGPDRYREFHYEDLIEDPEATVRAICEWLGLEFQEEMLDYQGTAEKFLAEAKNPADHQHLTLAPTKGLVDWRRSMSSDDVALFEAIAGDTLEAVGYQCVSSSKISSVVAGWEWARWQTKRVLWRGSVGCSFVDSPVARICSGWLRLNFVVLTWSEMRSSCRDVLEASSLLTTPEPLIVRPRSSMP